MIATVAVSVDTGRGATLSSRKEEFYAAITDERHGLRWRRLRADQRKAQRGDRLPQDRRWLARSHRERGDRRRRRRYAAPSVSGFRHLVGRRPVPAGDERCQRRLKRLLGGHRR